MSNIAAQGFGAHAVRKEKINGPSGRTIPRGIAALLGVDVLLGLAAVAGFAASVAFGVTNPDLFRLSEESTIPTWFSSTQLFGIAVLLGVWAWHHQRQAREAGRGGGWLLWTVPALFAALSLDEIAMLHERIGHLADGMVSSREQLEAAGLRTGLWMFICVPLFVAALVFVVRAIWPLLRGKRAVLIKAGVGMGIFLGCAVGLESVANFFATGSMMLKLEGMVEEVGEMIGATILLWAAWDLLKSDKVELKFGQG